MFPGYPETDGVRSAVGQVKVKNRAVIMAYRNIVGINSGSLFTAGSAAASIWETVILVFNTEPDDSAGCGGAGHQPDIIIVCIEDGSPVC